MSNFPANRFWKHGRKNTDQPGQHAAAMRRRSYSASTKYHYSTTVLLSAHRPAAKVSVKPARLPQTSMHVISISKSRHPHPQILICAHLALSVQPHLPSPLCLSWPMPGCSQLGEVPVCEFSSLCNGTRLSTCPPPTPSILQSPLSAMPVGKKERQCIASMELHGDRDISSLQTVCNLFGGIRSTVARRFVWRLATTKLEHRTLGGGERYILNSHFQPPAQQSSCPRAERTAMHWFGWYLSLLHAT